MAREVVKAEKDVDPVEEQDKARAALTELFTELKGSKTPVVVERIVADIDEIVRLVRFPGWQHTEAGEREVRKALRKVIYVKYKIKTCSTKHSATSGSITNFVLLSGKVLN